MPTWPLYEGLSSMNRKRKEPTPKNTPQDHLKNHIEHLKKAEAELQACLHFLLTDKTIKGIGVHESGPILRAVRIADTQAGIAHMKLSGILGEIERAEATLKKHAAGE
jgi:hypothetical protein